MKLLYLLAFIFVFSSCENNTVNLQLPTSKKIQPKKIALLTTHKESYISEKKEKEALQSQITTKYGQQYTFCECVQKGDSLNKALKNKKLTDNELDRLLLRFDEIDEKCQAFRINNANATPLERQRYSRKVKKCLQ
jgi:biopolymer transport protein ExbD